MHETKASAVFCSECAKALQSYQCHDLLQVLSKVCNICTQVVTDMPQLAKGDAHTIITGVVDKLSDTKIQPHALELLSALSEVCSFPSSFLSTFLYHM